MGKNLIILKYKKVKSKYLKKIVIIFSKCKLKKLLSFFENLIFFGYMIRKYFNFN